MSGSLIARVCRLYVVTVDRIIWTVDEPETFAFGYGTLPVHPEVGEEAFAVAREPDGRVRFVVTFCRLHPFLRPCGPLVRHRQVAITNAFLAEIRAAAESTVADPQ